MYILILWASKLPSKHYHLLYNIVTQFIVLSGALVSACHVWQFFNTYAFSACLRQINHFVQN